MIDKLVDIFLKFGNDWASFEWELLSLFQEPPKNCAYKSDGVFFDQKNNYKADADAHGSY